MALQWFTEIGQLQDRLNVQESVEPFVYQTRGSGKLRTINRSIHTSINGALKRDALIHGERVLLFPSKMKSTRFPVRDKSENTFINM